MDRRYGCAARARRRPTAACKPDERGNDLTPMPDDAFLRKPPSRPGAALRKLRTRKGLTLAEVSRRTGLPLSTLSKVENDKMSLTYDKLVRIAEGLEIDIEALFAGESEAPPSAPSGRRSVARLGEGAAIDTPQYDYLYTAAELLQKQFVPILIDVKARSIDEVGELSRHGGEEYVYVVEGAVEMFSDLYAPTRLATGESIYFDSGMAHAFIAAAPGPCRILSICSHPETPRVPQSDAAPTEA
jgi:transcriptional regulator with XRE-family HTH domain